VSKRRSHGLSARLQLPDNTEKPISIRNAKQLLNRKKAVLVCHRPLTVKLISNNSRLEYFEELLVLSGYRYHHHHRTRKPREAFHDPVSNDVQQYSKNYAPPDGGLIAEEVMRKRKLRRNHSMFKQWRQT